MSVMNSAINMDPTVIAGNASFSSVSPIPLKTAKGDSEVLGKKVEKNKKFTEVLKEKFAIVGMPLAVSDEMNVSFTEEEYLEKLQDDVHLAGDALSDAVSTENILLYKNAIKKFVNYILDKAYRIENVVTSSLNPARKKAWTIVKVINKKLDTLVADLMFNQLKKMEILQRIDEIKGLIVDLRG